MALWAPIFFSVLLSGCAALLSGDLFMIGSFGPSALRITAVNPVAKKSAIVRTSLKSVLAPSALDLTPNAREAGLASIEAGSCHGFVAEAIDLDNQSFMALEPTRLQVHSDNAQVYLDAGCASPAVSTLMISAGRSAVTFYVRASAAGPVRLSLDTESGLAQGELSDLRARAPASENIAR